MDTRAAQAELAISPFPAAEKKADWWNLKFSCSIETKIYISNLLRELAKFEWRHCRQLSALSIPSFRTVST